MGLAPDLCVSFRVRAARRCMPVGSLDATNFCVFSRYGGPREECSTHIRHVLIRSADARSAVRFSVGGNMLAVACGKAFFPGGVETCGPRRTAQSDGVVALDPFVPPPRQAMLVAARRGNPFRRYGPHRREHEK